LEALLEGQATPEQVAQLAQRKAKKKIPEIMAALEGHPMSAHHRTLIRYSLEHRQFLEEQILKLDEDIAAKIREGQLEPHGQLLQSGDSGNQRGCDSGGDGRRNDRVSIGPGPQLRGRALPGKQSQCWEKQKQPYDRWPSVAAQCAGGMLVGSEHQARLLLEGEILAHGLQDPGSPPGASSDRGGA
jgi:hypothetical protein